MVYSQGNQQWRQTRNSSIHSYTLIFSIHITHISLVHIIATRCVDTRREQWWK
jgi:hypothetical protein